jgi:hypothetical protein
VDRFSVDQAVKVFLSSVCDDRQSAREAIHKALLHLEMVEEQLEHVEEFEVNSHGMLTLGMEVGRKLQGGEQ